MGCERSVSRALGLAIGFARTHDDQPPVCIEGGVVRIHRVQRKIGGRRKLQNLGPGGSQLTAESFVLRLGLREIGRVMESQFPPTSHTVWLIPSCGTWRAHQHAL